MKKLMTMIAAVATAFGLYAAGNTWSPSGDALGKTLDVLKADDGTTGELYRYWSYSDSEGVAAGEAEVTAEGQLTLKTGSKILTRNINGVMSGTETSFDPVAIPAESNEVGLFFDTKTIFGAPCDDFAALAETDKFAAFFLDETELGIGGITDAATNLWVIGSDGTTETAFRMQLWNANNTPVTIDENWLNAEKRVVIKAYADGNGALPGFVVYVANGENGNFATVMGKAPISNGTIGTYTAVSTANYLTGTIGVPGRYTDRQLVLGRVAAADGLFGEAFKGTGTITGLTVGDTCPSDLTEEFTETQFMTVDAEDVTISDVTGAIYDSEKGQFAGKNDTEVTFKATSDDPDTKTLITISGVDYTEDQGVYTITFDDQATLTVKAVAPAATVNGKAYATFAEALEAAAELDTVALTLNGPAAMEEGEAIEIAENKEWTIDLKGQTLSFVMSGDPCISNAGTLTIKDSATGGKIENSEDSALVSNDGTVHIESGIFDLALFAEEAEGAYDISGGSFRKPDNGTDAFAYAKGIVDGKEATLAGDYWKVQEITVTEVDLPAAAAYTYDATAKTPYAETAQYTVTGDTTGTDADSYTVTFALKDKVHNKWKTLDTTDDQQVTWTIAQAEVAVPTADPTEFTYDGNAMIVYTVPDGAKFKETDDSVSTATDAGDYAAKFELLDTKNYKWATTYADINWSIKAKAVTVTVELDKTEANVGDQAPVVTVKFDSVAAADGSFDIAWEPTLDMNTAAEYTCTATAKGNYSGTSEGVKFTVKSAAPVDPVDPEEPKTYDDPDEATAMALLINADKPGMIKSPAAAGLTGEAHAAYANRFEAVANGKTVTVQLLPAEKEALETQAANDTKTIPVSTIAAATGSTDQEITVTPGFYYSVIAADSLDGMKVTSCEVATGSKLTVTIPHYENSGFYTIKASVKEQTTDAAFVEDK